MTLINAVNRLIGLKTILSGQQLVLFSVFVLEKGKGVCSRKDEICPVLLQKKYSKAFKAVLPNIVTVLADLFYFIFFFLHWFIISHKLYHTLRSFKCYSGRYLKQSSLSLHELLLMLQAQKKKTTKHVGRWIPEVYALLFPSGSVLNQCLRKRTSACHFSSGRKINLNFY